MEKVIRSIASDIFEKYLTEPLVNSSKRLKFPQNDRGTNFIAPLRMYVSL